MSGPKVKIKVRRKLVGRGVRRCAPPYLAQRVHLPLLFSVKKRIMVLHRDEWSKSVVQCAVCSECEER